MRMMIISLLLDGREDNHWSARVVSIKYISIWDRAWAKAASGWVMVAWLALVPRSV